MAIQKISPKKYAVISSGGAFDAKELLRIAEECEDGAKIVFEPGDYYFPSAENAVKLRGIRKNIAFEAAGGARFIGGKSVSGSIPAPKKAKERFFPEARDKIFCVDLKNGGIDDVCGFVSRGFGREVTPSHSEAFADGMPLNLSRYPKNGYLEITGYGEEETNEWAQKVGKLDKGFFYESGRPEKWAAADDILVHGYWSWDWANSYEKIAEIDKKSGKILTEEPYGQYAFKPGQRFNFYNILEEVTENGDYYIDKKEMILYYIPHNGQTPPEEILISTLKEPLWSVSGCENLCFEGFRMESTCGGGIAVENCGNIKISACEFKNIGNCAVTISKCRNVTVENCDIHDCGDGGISVSCGNRATLEPGNVKIDNNHIFKIAKWTRTYQTAVNASGVGIEIKNNLIHDCPHTGILFWGNEIQVKNNEIYSALLETGDAGAVYTGRDYTYRGNAVSGNYIHHLGGVGMGTMGIYNDDCVSGTLMEENIFFEVQRAVFLGGGRNFLVKGNLFVDCHPSIEIDGRGTSSHAIWRKMVDEYMRDKFYNIKDGGISAGAMDEPYISRYPELAEVDGFYRENLPIPPSAAIEGNVYCSNKKLEFTWDYEPGEFTVRKNKSVGRDYFEDYTIGLFDIKEGTDAEMYGFKRLEMAKCGLDEKRRKANPPRILTGLGFEAGNLVFKYKNFSDINAKGKIRLYSEDIELAPFEADIGANSEGAIKIPLEIEPNKQISIEARSDVAGIRPCRAKINAMR
ncbi:MAG: right-handed parallel beta-helix repeat-containing protein [Oscillospiraceae bacterium]|nr:right-handed parallel beta-helix repeat-containing protein [Oscillospiraceae bacterium]